MTSWSLRDRVDDPRSCLWSAGTPKKPLAVCGDAPEMNKKLLLPLFFLTTDVHKEKWDEIVTSK